MNCPKHKDTELVKVKEKKGVRKGYCEKCNKKYIWTKAVDMRQFTRMKDGSLRRKNPKIKISKAEKKRAIREKHQRSKSDELS